MIYNNHEFTLHGIIQTKYRYRSYELHEFQIYTDIISSRNLKLIYAHFYKPTISRIYKIEMR